MALKSKRPPAGGPTGAARKTTQAVMAGEVLYAGAWSLGLRRTGAVETIEARLERKARAADTATFATKSLGQMSRAERHKLLYGE